MIEKRGMPTHDSASQCRQGERDRHRGMPTSLVWAKLGRGTMDAIWTRAGGRAQGAADFTCVIA